MRAVYCVCWRHGSAIILFCLYGLLICLSLAYTTIVDAQTIEPPPLPPPVLPTDAWPPLPDYGVNSIGFSFIQSASSNWANGEQNYFTATVNAATNGETQHGFLRFRRFFTLDLGARYSRDSSDFYPVRVSENEFFGEALFSYSLGWAINPYVSANLRTPILRSYRYTEFGRTEIADFWDPVTTQQSIGFSFSRVKGPSFYSTRLGIALKQTRSQDNTYLSDDFLTPEVETYRAESGIESVSDAYIVLDSTISYSGRLELFGTFKRPDVWTVNARNQVQAKVWKFIAGTLSVDVVHNTAQSLHTQFRQALMLGVIENF